MPVNSQLARRKNELWYRSRLRVVAEDMKAEVTPALAKLIQTLPSTRDNVQDGERVAVKHGVDGIISRAAHRFTMPISPERTARFAARMNLLSTDVWWTRQMRKLRVSLTPAALPKPTRFGDAAPARVRIGLTAGPVTPLGTLSIIRGQDEIETAFNDAVDTNIALITSIPAQYYPRLKDELYDNIDSAERWETLVDRMKDGVDGVNNLADYRVRLIARDQTSKMASAFNEARSASVGITQYTWQTAGDERVRPAHEDNDGEVFSFDEGAVIDEDGTMGNPGDAVNCRCVAIPYVEEAEDEESEAA